VHWDTELFLLLNLRTPHPLAVAFYGLTVLGRPLAYFLWIPLIALLTRSRGPWRSVYPALTVTLATALEEALKHAVGRPRPWRVLPQMHILGKLELDPSFPSGHATASFALAVALMLAFPRVRAWPLLLASLVALSRPIVGMHYPTDVLAGAILGSLVALLVWLVWRRGAGREAAREPQSG
jgi:membrane-associated phospholipid phosphatase